MIHETGCTRLSARRTQSALADFFRRVRVRGLRSEDSLYRLSPIRNSSCAKKPTDGAPIWTYPTSQLFKRKIFRSARNCGHGAQKSKDVTNHFPAENCCTQA